MELFDLVDRNDKVIGTTNKLKAHKDGGIHRIVAIFVFDKNGELYVQEHLASGNILDHSVGGHVKKGESYAHAAKREAEEELGLVAEISKISEFYSDETWGGKNVRHFICLYECQAPDNWSFKGNNEVKNIFPLAVPAIVKQMNSSPRNFTGGFKNTLFEYIKRKGLKLHLKNYNLV